jgi:rubrerythrin
MRTYHEQLLTQMGQERERIMSRRRLLTGGMGIAGGAVALGLSARGGGFGLASTFAQDDEAPFADDIEVLNYALTLEHLESAFYRDGAGLYDFGVDGYGNTISDFMAQIAAHEAEHVAVLTQVITDLGGEPVAEATYDFGHTDAASFLATAAALENTGVSAYDGAGQYLEDPGLLTAAGSIVAIEARHASYLNLITGEDPASAAFEQAKTPAEILEIAGPFIVQ